MKKIIRKIALLTAVVASAVIILNHSEEDEEKVSVKKDDDSGVEDTPSKDEKLSENGDKEFDANSDMNNSTFDIDDSVREVIFDGVGKFNLKERFVEMKNVSTDEKKFFCVIGHETDERPNNISISKVNNIYGASEHKSFKDDITEQLKQQTANYDIESINSLSSFTYEGDMMYEFTIKEKNDIVTRQYYIVGDYCSVLVHETTFSKSEECDGAALEMAKSFKWE